MSAAPPSRRWQLDRADLLEWAPSYAQRIAAGEAEPFHAALGDLPYLLEFMGSGQRDAPHRQLQRDDPAAVAAIRDALGLQPWQAAAILWFKRVGEAVRSVCYPGALFLAFGGARTSDLLAVGLRAAGWQVFDQMVYMYATGMPHGQHLANVLAGDDAAAFADYRSQLKPAYEPLILARAPFRGNLGDIAAQYGTGALNIGDTRIAVRGERPLREVQRGEATPGKHTFSATHGGTSGLAAGTTTEGRYPSNVVMQHAPACVLLGLRQVRNVSGSVQHAPDAAPSRYAYNPIKQAAFAAYGDADGLETVEDWDCAPDCPAAALEAHSCGPQTSSGEPVGGASRFFYTGKATTWERYAGLPHGADNPHPTLKSIDTLSHFCALLKPPARFNPRLLVPTAGVGSEMIAALLAGWQFVHGVELDEDRQHRGQYVEIGRQRLAWWSQFGTFEQAEAAYGRSRAAFREREALAARYKAAGVEQLPLI